MEEKINLYIISGFLGSGKTSFLKRVLNGIDGRKTGVIVNEAGDISIDSARLEQKGITSIEMTNGSVYCACLKGKFTTALIELSRKALDILFIENSGMADPSNIHRILKDLEPYTEKKYNYCGNICIADAKNFLAHSEVLECVSRQICSAGIVLINKCDLVDKDKLEAVRARVFDINPNVRIFETKYCDFPVDMLDKYIYDNGYDEETTNLCDNKLASCSLRYKEDIDLDKLENFLNMISDDFYRIKGNVHTQNGWFQIDVTEGIYDSVKCDAGEDVDSAMVFISKERYINYSWLKQLWKEFVKVEIL